MFDALTAAQGKPDSKLRIIFVGTLAPALSGCGHDLVNRGSADGIYVQAIGSGLIKSPHSQNLTIAAKVTTPRKIFGHLWTRSATCLGSGNLPIRNLYAFSLFLVGTHLCDIPNDYI